MNHAKNACKLDYTVSSIHFLFFFLSLKKRACAFNTWIEKNIYSRHNKCYIAVIRQAKWWWSHALPFTKFTEGFTSVNITVQKRSVLDFQYASFLQIIHFLQDKGYVVSQLLKLCNWHLKQKVQFNKHDTL